jgi:hypothetical protein
MTKIFTLTAALIIALPSIASAVQSAKAADTYSRTQNLGENIRGDLVRGTLVHGDLVRGTLVHGDLVRGTLVHGDLVRGAPVRGEKVWGEKVWGEKIGQD